MREKINSYIYFQHSICTYTMCIKLCMELYTTSLSAQPDTKYSYLENKEVRGSAGAADAVLSACALWKWCWLLRYYFSSFNLSFGFIPVGMVEFRQSAHTRWDISIMSLVFESVYNHFCLSVAPYGVPKNVENATGWFVPKFLRTISLSKGEWGGVNTRQV